MSRSDAEAERHDKTNRHGRSPTTRAERADGDGGSLASRIGSFIPSQLQMLGERLRSSLWFIPTLMVVAAVALALGLVQTDILNRGELAERWPRIFGAGAEGSRGLLSAVAGSMITTAGVTFSITVVALALASNQYTPRILRNFMRDRGNQTVMGVFLGVFAYCLVVLRTVRGDEDNGVFVPPLAVLGGLMLALVAIGFLIYFIHHIADSIQASSIIDAAANETLSAVDRVFPEQEETAHEETAHEEEAAQGSSTDDALLPPPNEAWLPVAARSNGYIQDVGMERLFRVACERDVVVRMERSVGDFVIEGCPLVAIAGEPPDQDLVAAINAAYTIDRHRTVQQDVGFGIRQIVDVALKALSPGINDTTTAVTCVDFLGAILARLATRKLTVPPRSDRERVRVLHRGPDFEALLSQSFDQIRHHAETNRVVLVRQLEVLAMLTARTASLERRRALRRQAKRVVKTAERGIRDADDLNRLHSAAARTFAVLPNRAEIDEELPVE